MDRVPRPPPPTLVDPLLRGKEISYIPCVGTDRMYGVYLLGVKELPTYEVNRFIKFCKGQHLQVTGRSIDDPDWKYGKAWRDAVDRIDALNAEVTEQASSE